jgi:uncharacterized membrane protein YeaQ/YmgE (transglycosylase-associated protein family)
MEIGIVSWIVVGFIAGLLGKLIMPGRDPGGFLLTIVIGMIGAIVGGFVVQLLGGAGGYRVQHLVDLGSHAGGDHSAGYLQGIRQSKSVDSPANYLSSLIRD